ncbi:MAG: Uma2 family endonuclease [Beijerinckiaceae bacterium]
MSALLKQKPRYNVAAFVELTRPFPNHERWELLDGEPVMMAPQSVVHQGVVSNLLAKCRQLARSRGCREYPGLGILNNDIDDYAPIPDIVVRCGPPVQGGYIADPVVIAEILSPSTAANDRGRKLEFYKMISSLKTILLVYANERRVEHWTRGGNDWIEGVTQGDGIVPLEGVGGEISLDEVYEGLDG